MYKECKNPNCTRGQNSQRAGWHEPMRGMAKGRPKIYCCRACSQSILTAEYQERKRAHINMEYDPTAQRRQTCHICGEKYFPFLMKDQTFRPYCSPECKLYAHPNLMTNIDDYIDGALRKQNENARRIVIPKLIAKGMLKEDQEEWEDWLKANPLPGEKPVSKCPWNTIKHDTPHA